MLHREQLAVDQRQGPGLAQGLELGFRQGLEGNLVDALQALAGGGLDRQRPGLDQGVLGEQGAEALGALAVSSDLLEKGKDLTHRFRGLAVGVEEGLAFFGIRVGSVS